jgi:hypothetical protein
MLSGCMFSVFLFLLLPVFFSTSQVINNPVLFPSIHFKYVFNILSQTSWLPDTNNSLPASVLTLALTRTVQKHPVASDRYMWFSWLSTQRIWMFAGSVWSTVIAFPTDGFWGQVQSSVDELSLLKHYSAINQEIYTKIYTSGQLFWDTLSYSWHTFMLTYISSVYTRRHSTWKFLTCKLRQSTRSSNETTGWTLQKFWFDSCQRQEIFLFYTSFRLALGPTYPEGCFPRVKQQPGHEAGHSLPSNNEIKNEWRYTSTPIYASMACTETAWPLFVCC